MKSVAFDIETDGLFDAVSKIHALVLRDLDTGVVLSCADQPGYAPISQGLAVLSAADLVVGHNIIKYDLPVLRKLIPGFAVKGLVRDTLVCSRLIWADIKEADFVFQKKNPAFPSRLIGRHSLESWGHRLGVLKGDFGKESDWQSWSPEMSAYCEQDVAVTVALWEHVKDKGYAESAIDLEHRFAEVIRAQEEHGWVFDMRRAQALYASLSARRAAIEAELQRVFRPWFAPAGLFVPKRDNRAAGYVAGCAFTKVELTTFNPASRDHIADRLRALRGWVPSELTEGGKPKVDESVLSKLDWPEARLLNEYLLVGKRIGQLAEGDQAWLKLARQHGAHWRIHGEVITNGAVTGRCTHQRPNVAQVPSVQKGKKDGQEVVLWGAEGGYGADCRSLFTVLPGYRLVGCDASGLELRCLAHFMGRYDGGAYGKVILEGDIHTANQQAAGLATRGQAKTFIYAYLYGAGDEKIGTITGVSDEEIRLFKKAERKRWGSAKRMLERQERQADDRTIATIVKGAILKAAFLDKTPALKRLKEDIDAVVKERGYLVGLDGRRLHVRSSHAALNTLLQSAGALAVKQATVFLHDDLSARGYAQGRHYALVGHIHDEMQLMVKEELADEIGQAAVAAIRRAGAHFGFRCPLDGEYRVGGNWEETH